MSFCPYSIDDLSFPPVPGFALVAMVERLGFRPLRPPPYSGVHIQGCPSRQDIILSFSETSGLQSGDTPRLRLYRIPSRTGVDRPIQIVSPVWASRLQGIYLPD